MNITIGVIKINSISNIGSLNIGKTILAKNQASSAVHYANSNVEEPPAQVAPTTPLSSPPVLGPSEAPQIVSPSGLY